MAERHNIKKYQDLPQAARSYVERIREIAQVPVVMVSVSPKRDQTILNGNIVCK